MHSLNSEREWRLRTLITDLSLMSIAYPKVKIMVVGIGSKNAPYISTTQNKASILFLTFHVMKKL